MVGSLVNSTGEPAMALERNDMNHVIKGAWTQKKGWSFEIGRFHCWELSNGSFQTAFLDDMNVYSQHKQFDYLEEALNRLRQLAREYVDGGNP